MWRDLMLVVAIDPAVVEANNYENRSYMNTTSSTNEYTRSPSSCQYSHRYTSCSLDNCITSSSCSQCHLQAVPNLCLWITKNTLLNHGSQWLAGHLSRIEGQIIPDMSAIAQISWARWPRPKAPWRSIYTKMYRRLLHLLKYVWY
jgi:hypothetical protein